MCVYARQNIAIIQIAVLSPDKKAQFKEKSPSCRLQNH